MRITSPPSIPSLKRNNSESATPASSDQGERGRVIIVASRIVARIHPGPLATDRSLNTISQSDVVEFIIDVVLRVVF